MRPHALLTPSAAHRWLRCPGSVALEAARPAIPSESANELAAAHELAATALLFCADADAGLGERIEIDGGEWEVTADMVDHIQTYLDYVRDIGGGLLVEQRLNLESITGEADATAIADALILTEHELIIVDLDYSRDTKAQAAANARLQLHALAALDEFAFLGDFQRARLLIVQPRLNHIDEWTCSVADLREFGRQAAQAAARCLNAVTHHRKHRAPRADHLIPGPAQCQHCKAKASCPARSAHAAERAVDEAAALV